MCLPFSAGHVHNRQFSSQVNSHPVYIVNLGGQTALCVRRNTVQNANNTNIDSTHLQQTG